MALAVSISPARVAALIARAFSTHLDLLVVGAASCLATRKPTKVRSMFRPERSRRSEEGNWCETNIRLESEECVPVRTRRTLQECKEERKSGEHVCHAFFVVLMSGTFQAEKNIPEFRRSDAATQNPHDHLGSQSRCKEDCSIRLRINTRTTSRACRRRRRLLFHRPHHHPLAADQSAT